MDKGVYIEKSISEIASGKVLYRIHLCLLWAYISLLQCFCTVATAWEANRGGGLGAGGIRFPRKGYSICVNMLIAFADFSDVTCSTYTVGACAHSSQTDFSRNGRSENTSLPVSCQNWIFCRSSSSGCNFCEQGEFNDLRFHDFMLPNSILGKTREK